MQFHTTASPNPVALLLKKRPAAEQPPEEEPDLDAMDETARMNYALGYQLGRDLAGFELRSDVLLRGIDDGRKGTAAALAPEEMQASLTSLEQRLNEQRAKQQAEAMKQSQAAGASYVNIGPIFPTQTKEWQDAFLGVEGIKRIAPVLGVPFTIMGGIKAHHVPELRAAGAHTVALVTAVTAAPDPAQATRELLELLRR